MKQANARLVFEEIYKGRAVSRPGLSKSTGLTTMSTGRIADELIALGLVAEAHEPDTSAHGRPPMLLRVARESTCCLAVALNAACASVGIVDPYGKILRSTQYPIAFSQCAPQEGLRQLGDALEAFLAEAPFPLLPAIGVSVPGNAAPDGQAVQASRALHWQDVPLAALLAPHTPGFSIVAAHTAAARMRAEMRYGALAGHVRGALLHLGLEVWAATAASDGGFPGALAHLPLGPQGMLCTCGRTGCLQTGLGWEAILRQAHAMQADMPLEAILGPGDKPPWAEALALEAERCAAAAVCVLAAAASPDAIVLCGDTPVRFPHLISRIEARYAALRSPLVPEAPLRSSPLGEMGDVCGAGAIAFEHMLDTIIV